MDSRKIKSVSSLLESIYSEYHHPSFIHPDPIEFLFNYSKTEDREIAGLIASSLATGRVNSILKTADEVLQKLPSPYKNLSEMDISDIENLFKDFKYRFYNSQSITDLLSGIKNTLTEYGSLNSLFASSLKKSADSIPDALILFADTLNRNNTASYSLIPSPSKGSACKKLNLFLRWMIRKDSIDPGGWDDISSSLLVVPLDTHMMQISTILNFVSRKSADMKSALEITENLKKYDPEDPVRFDFSLTRLGIHPLLDYSRLL